MNQFTKALIAGTLGAFFFAFNFVLIRSMNLGGGYFLWTAVLRYVFTLPLMAVLLIPGKGFGPVFRSIKNKPAKWFVWSTVGFGLFYSFCSAASIYGESWFTAAVWQFTIVAGVLLTPLFGKPVPKKNLLWSGVILLGIFLMQASKMRAGVEVRWGMLMLTIVIAAFSYPLGNRKMMQVIEEDGLSTTQRVFGMTLCSMPFWLVCAVLSYGKAGLPSGSQCFQSLLLALLAGVIATILFFKATDLVRNDPKRLAVIEATQSGEVVFSLILGVLLLKDRAPDAMALLGIAVIVAGMVLNSLAASEKT